ncbi:MAG: DNA-processing protein DprA [Candidatus Omnitrophica bacterium]|nr:DNA-processing protein DprA [Candidatus Omnitrophota bacterium]
MALSLTGFSPGKLRQLLDRLGSPERIFSASPGELQSLALSPEAIDRLQHPERLPLKETIEKCHQHNLRLIPLIDSEYPAYLRQIADPPALLYLKGRFSPRDNLALAIVGTRHPSFYGLKMAEKFACQLAELGVTIVSGLARGIDTQAHLGALKVHGRTIAVLGSGHSHLYPPENAKLAEEITQNGAVISEFPPETLPLRENFPRRNRIISGLTRGVLVVEAGQRSGALITAGLAAEQNREVFALPGQVGSPTSTGTHCLLKEGAKLVETVQDILEELNLEIKPGGEPTENKGTRESAERCILSLLQEPCSIEELAANTGQGIPELSALLVQLELKGLVKSLPGKRYCLIERSGKKNKL